MPYQFCRHCSALPWVCISKKLIPVGLLGVFISGAFAEGNTTTPTQTTVADYSNNGLNLPSAVAVGSGGDLFIVDTGNNRIVEEPWNSSTKKYGTQSIVVNNLFSPSSAAVGANGTLFIADTGNNRIVVLPWNQATGTYGPEATIGEGLNSPKGITVAPSGSVYIADTGNSRVIEVPFDKDKGTYGPQTTVGVDLLSPEAVRIGEGGKLYIANTGNNSVVEVPANCNATTSCTTQTTVANQANNNLSYPNDLAVAPSGTLFITQPNNNQVLQLPWNRTTSTYGTPTPVGKDLDGPKGVAFDAMGSIYIADTLNNRVLKISQQQSGSRPSGNSMGGMSRRRPQ